MRPTLRHRHTTLRSSSHTTGAPHHGQLLSPARSVSRKWVHPSIPSELAAPATAAETPRGRPHQEMNAPASEPTTCLEPTHREQARGRLRRHMLTHQTPAGHRLHLEPEASRSSVHTFNPNLTPKTPPCSLCPAPQAALLADRGAATVMKVSEARVRATRHPARWNVPFMAPPPNEGARSPPPCRGHQHATPFRTTGRSIRPVACAKGDPRPWLSGPARPDHRDRDQLQQPPHRDRHGPRWTTSPSVWTTQTRPATHLWNRHTQCRRLLPSRPTWRPRLRPRLDPPPRSSVLPHSPRTGTTMSLDILPLANSPHSGPLPAPRPNRDTHNPPSPPPIPGHRVASRTITYPCLQVTRHQHGP